MISKKELSKTKWVEKEIKNLKNKGLLINIREIQSPMNGKIRVDGKNVLNFCANDYLGLANHPRIKKAAKAAIDNYGVGPGAVRTIAGTTSLHIKLEKALAKFKKCEDVITFQSGFVANLAAIPALVGEGDLIFSDELNHASIIDGCRLSRANVIRYKHLNVNDLEAKVKSLSEPEDSPSRRQKSKVRKLIVTDGVFSMDGDIAPLPELATIASKYDALLMVDDAHGEGVLGRNGAGIVDHFNLHGKVDIEIGTMSKAFGVVGGMAAGKKIVIDWLRQRGRPFLFSSAMTAPDTGACLEAVKILDTSDNLVKRLWKNAEYFKSKMKDLGFDIGNSQTPITPVMLGDAKLAKEFSQTLFNNGIFAIAITYPTVPEGKARIRVMISASHTKTDLDKALKIFESAGKKLKVI